MNKKLKWAIPFAVLSLTCGVAAGAAGCSKHEHSYTQLKNDGDTHVMVCPDDDTPDESTREGHVYVAGECECGATEQQAEIKYGSVTGSVRLYKSGEYVSADGVKVEIDADADVEGSVKDGKYVYTIENVPVGESYELTISKSGYETKKYEILLEEEGEEATIGGANGITLNYEVFGLFAGWDSASHDLTHANDADPYILFREHTGDQTLNVITKDSYNGVSASFDVNYNNSTHNWRTQGIILKFSDGKHMVVRYHNGDSSNEKGGLGNIQFAAEAWDFFPKENSLFGEDVTGTQYGEKPFYQLSAADTQGIKSEEGVRLTTVVNDGKLTVMFGGKYICEYALPDGYADKPVQVAYFAFNAASNAKFTYEITKSIPALESVLDIDVTKPEGADCTVTANPQKDKYSFGEEIELTFTAQEGYKLDSLTVDGEDRYNDVNEGKLTVIANRETINIAATFVKEEPININVSVKGKKLGTTAALADGTKVALGGTEYTVTNGAITGNVVKGRYTVSVDGYISKEIIIDENLTEIVFEYDAFEIVRWDHSGHGLAHVNDSEPYIEWEGPGASLNAVTKECLFTNASVSVIIKGGFTTNGGKQQGIILRFEDGKAAILNINIDGDARLQFRPELFSDNNDASIGLSTVFEKEWVEFRNVTDAEVQKYNSETGIDLKVLRYGKSLFVYLDGEFKGRADLPDKYENSKMGFGLFSYDAVVGSKWKYEISENVSVPTVEITNETPSDANGTVSVSQNTVIGDTVTITVTPATGYKLGTLTVNGTDVTSQIDGMQYTFAVTGDTTVAATFEEIVKGSIDAQITGKKHGVSDNALTAGTQVTLSSGGLDDVTATLTNENGVLMLSVIEIPAAVWTVKIAGYLTAEITVGENAEYTTAIALEADTFNTLTPWGKFDFSQANNETTAVIGFTNDCGEFVTKETYDDVAASIVLNKDMLTSNQGVVVRFVGDGMNDLVYVRLEGSKKVQFADDPLWNSNKAEGSGWQDLIFLKETVEGDTTHQACAKAEEYLAAIEAGTLRLTLLRVKNVVHVFLGDDYIGSRTFAEKYADVKCEVGVAATGVPNKGEDAAITDYNKVSFELADADTYKGKLPNQPDSAE